MAAGRLGTVFVELKLDSTALERQQQKLLSDIKAVGANVEGSLGKAFQNLGVKTDQVYQLMANKAIASYERIAQSADRSAAEQFRAQSAMIAKINALNMEMTRNPLYEQLGIRSMAEITARKEAVMRSYDTLRAAAQGNAAEVIRIEKAKNDEMKRLDKELAGEHEMSMAAMTRAVLRFYAAWYVVTSALPVIAAPFKKGFEAAEEYGQAVASLGAMAVTFGERQKGMDLAGQWKESLKYSTAMVPVLENIAAKTLLSGQETTALANAFARSGVFLNANNSSQIEGFTRISNALPLMTQGQEIMRQINTEIRSLMTGANEQSSMLLTTMKALPGFSMENLHLWQRQGTVLEHIGELLVGFGPATALLENQWQAVKSTIDTTANQILRGMMKPAYDDIIKSTKELNKYLLQNKDTLIEWSKGVYDRLKMVKEYVGYLVTAARIFSGTPYQPEKEWDVSVGHQAPPPPKGREIVDKAAEKAAEAHRNKLAEMTAQNREYYDDAVLKADHWLKMQKLGGESDLESTKDVINQKKIALTEWYKAQAASINQYVDGESKRAAELEKLWREYSRSWTKLEYDDAETAAQISKKAEDDAIKGMEKEIALGVKLTEESLKQIEKRGTLERRIYTDLRKSKDSYYESEMELIRRGEKEFRDAGIEESLIAKWVESQKILALEKTLSTTANFYSEITGYEDEYRKKKFAWIDEEAKKRAQLFEDDVAAAKWAAQEKGKIDQDLFEKKSAQVSTALGQMASMFQSIGSMYDKNSAEYARMQDAAKAMIVLQNAVAVANAVATIANQGLGDPYTAFARIAAMAAAMGALLASAGLSLSGASVSSVSPAPAYGQNTTVLGGENDQASESLKKSWEYLEDTYDMEYEKLTKIHNELKSLNDNITGLVTSIIRTGVAQWPEVNSSTMPGWWGVDETTWWKELPVLGTVLTWIEDLGVSILNGIFGGKTTYWSGASGIGIYGGQAGAFQQGVGTGGFTYQDMYSKEEGGWFHSDKYSYWRNTTALDASVVDLLSKVYQNLTDTLVELTIGLGQDITKTLAYVFPYGELVLNGLSGEQISETLMNYFSAQADAAVQALFGTLLKGYQELGEGLMETAVRLMVDKEIVLEVLAQTNQAYSGSTANAIELSEALIKLAGDLETLTDIASTYYDKFFSDEEKQARLQDQLTAALADLNMALPDARAGYRALVEGLDLATASGREAYVALLTMADSADAYYQAVEEAAEKTDKLRESLEQLSITIDEWLRNLSVSNLAPVTSAAEWERQYSLAVGKASLPEAAVEDVKDYLYFATKYLEFQKSFGTTESYQAIYDAVVADVMSIQAATLARHGSGGLTHGASIAGEIGPEWVVPTYEPQRTNFLQTVGADTETLGASIAKYLLESNGGSNGGDIHISVQIDGREIGNVVARQTRTNTDLQNSIRRLN